MMIGKTQMMPNLKKTRAVEKRARDLTEIERKTYEFIKEAGEIQTKNMPDSRMVGAISNLKNKGLVEIYKKYTSIYRRRKKKFVKAKT